MINRRKDTITLETEITEGGRLSLQSDELNQLYNAGIKKIKIVIQKPDVNAILPDEALKIRRIKEIQKIPAEVVCKFLRAKGQFCIDK